MSKTWAMFNTLQLITALPLLVIKVPANVAAFQTEFQKVVNLQIIPKETLKKWLFAGDEVTEKTQAGASTEAGWEAADIDTESLLPNVLLLVLSLIVAVLLIAVLVLMRKHLEAKCHPSVKKVYRSVKQKLMFNSVIRTLLQMYLLTAISTLVSLANFDKNGDRPGLNMTLAILIVIGLLAFPVFSYVHLKRNEDKLRTPDFKGSYGTLYQTVEYYKPEALVYTSIFLGRRLFFAATVAFLQSSVVLQVWLTVHASLLYMCWFVHVMPMIDWQNNAVQLINEYFFLFFSYYVYLFTDFVPDPETRYFFGTVYLWLLAANTGLNLVLIAIMVYQMVKQEIEKRKQKKVNKDKPQKKAVIPQTTEMEV